MEFKNLWLAWIRQKSEWVEQACSAQSFSLVMAVHSLPTALPQPSRTARWACSKWSLKKFITRSFTVRQLLLSFVRVSFFLTSTTSRDSYRAENWTERDFCVSARKSLFKYMLKYRALKNPCVISSHCQCWYHSQITQGGGRDASKVMLGPLPYAGPFPCHIQELCLCLV